MKQSANQQSAGRDGSDGTPSSSPPGRGSFPAAGRIAAVAVAIPIILWDAIRFAAPFWCAGRMGARPTVAWLWLVQPAVIVDAAKTIRCWRRRTA
jgi:hypothetical protein